MIDGIINNTPPLTNWKQRLRREKQFPLLTWLTRSKPTRERGKEAKPEKKPSIRAQLRADKEKAQKKKRKAEVTGLGKELTHAGTEQI